ncbi:MAG TPA: ribonuclease R, partial [Pseudorhodoplanes sp.]|nr:ribonuclease R [Pseudorhodoplanes sp.]
MAKHKTKQSSALPSKEALLSFIRERSGKVGTREIVRAFGLKNAARAELKRMLRDLADTGAVETRRKKLHQPGALPPVTLADVTGRDQDGELIAVPAEWDEQEHG